MSDHGPYSNLTATLNLKTTVVLTPAASLWTGRLVRLLNATLGGSFGLR